MQSFNNRINNSVTIYYLVPITTFFIQNIHRYNILLQSNKKSFYFYKHRTRYASCMIFFVSPKHREKTWLSQLLLLDI